jgi:ERCC4-related helicase
MVQRVLARDKVWRVQKCTDVTGGRKLYSLLAANDSSAIEILSPPDDVVPIEGEAPNFSKNSLAPFHSWNVAHDILNLGSIPSDSMAALYAGRISPEKYQFAPIKKLLALPRPCLLIADDVGLGKTIEAGLCITELIARGRARRVLLVLPPGIIPQWQEEMREKFGLEFQLIDNAAALERAQTSLAEGIKPWVYFDRIITSTEYLKKQEVYTSAFALRWDVVVVDEAHYLAESGTTFNPYLTNRARLGKRLRDNAEAILLLTATPHNGYKHSFRSLLEVVEPTDATFEGDSNAVRRRVERNVIRRLKKQIWKTGDDGKRIPAFKLRKPVEAIEIDGLADDESEIFRKVSSYCAKTSKAAHGSDQAEVISFVMQIIKKRMLSSRAALQQTVLRRLEALKSKGELEDAPTRGEIRELQGDLSLPDTDKERITRKVLSAISKDEKQRKGEISQLESIKKMLVKVEKKPDPKITKLLAELRNEVFSDKYEKAIIFTEYVDTLNSIKAALELEPEVAGHFVELTGSLSSKQRRDRIAQFERPETKLLLATDAASEGLNLQRTCRRIYHIELPWNPNRMEQRNGRVDRHGQTRTPIIKYLFYPDSPEDNVLHSLVRKIQQIQSDEISTPDILGLVQGLEIETVITNIDSTEEKPGAKDTLLEQLASNAQEFKVNFAPLLTRSVSSGEDDNLCADKAVDDDLLLEQTMGFLFQESLKPAELPHTFSLRVPRNLRAAGVSDFYPCVSFRRSIAGQYSSRDVEFVHRFHPLFRAAIADSFQKLTAGKALTGVNSRIAVRTSKNCKEPTIVFTFLVTDSPPSGTVVQVSVSSDKKAKPIISSWTNAASLERVGEVAWETVEKSFKSSFDLLLSSATELARTQALSLMEDETRRRQELVTILRDDLNNYKTDRLREIDKEEAAAKSRGAVQLTIFAEKDIYGFKAKRAAVDSYYQQRLSDLESFVQKIPVQTAHPLGALLVFPEEN